MKVYEQLRHVLQQKPCGLLTDIDGTISPIAPTPDAAFVSPEARASLQALARQLDVVAAVSGRAAADAAALVELPELVYLGNHGMDRLVAGAPVPLPEVEPYVAAVATVLHEAEIMFHPPGVLFENKGATGSVHYRLADDPAAAGAALKDLLEPLTAENNLRLTAGRLVWEIRPPLAIDKGAATRALVLERGLRGAFFFGDDTTDTDAFRTLRELREQGVCETLNVGVVGPETPDIVRELADIVVEGVRGVEQLLAELVTLSSETASAAEEPT